MRRARDLILSIASLVVLSPLLMLGAVAVKLGSRGPVFYRAKRVGLGGKEIGVLKFRTMVVSADVEGTITAGGDHRITKVGKVLRATKIDELPQLWTILRGDMSIVGPRPESSDIVERYYEEEDRELFTVRPGLTCPGNLLYYVYHEHLKPLPGMTTEEFYAEHLLRPKLLADLHYVRNRSWRYDWSLIVQTIYVIVMMLVGRQPKFEPHFASPPPEGWWGEGLVL